MIFWAKKDLIHALPLAACQRHGDFSKHDQADGPCHAAAAATFVRQVPATKLQGVVVAGSKVPKHSQLF